MKQPSFFASAKTRLITAWSGANWVQRVGALAISGIVLGIAALALLMLLVFVGAFGQLPSRADLAEIETDEASVLLDRNGKILARYYEQNREVAELDELPPVLIEALVSTEDERFFEHKGVDWTATARAIVYSVILRQTEQGGGSTLSQQLAKRHFPRSRMRGGIVIDKIKEGFVANRFEDVYSKEELIGLYLNSVDFGENIYGVKLAARRYFNTALLDLKTEHAAVLVGMLKGTSAYNPVAHPEKSLERRNLVLRRLSSQGFLSTNQMDSLSAMPLGLNEAKGRAQAHTSYLSEKLKPEIAAILFELAKESDEPELSIYKNGLRIYTTIDADLQGFAEAAVQSTMGDLQPSFRKHWEGRDPEQFAEQYAEAMKRSKRYKAMQASGMSAEDVVAGFGESREMTFIATAALGAGTRASSYKDSLRAELLRLRGGLVVADAFTEEMLAYVGGEDFAAVPFNSAAAKRQVGSTFKPIVYAAAIEAGVSPCDYFPNEQRTYTDYKDWTPSNADGEYGGEYSLVGGLVNSVNTIAVQLIFKAGVKRVQALAKDIGLTGVPAEPSIALGTPSLSLEDMLKVYGTFARHGTVPTYNFITRIETRNGEILYEHNEPVVDKQVMTRRTAEIMDYALRQVASRGTGAALYSRFGVQSEVAGKTGTTQNQADGWFMGYSRDLVFGAWVGGAYPTIRWRSLSLGQGARTALPIVGKFVRAYERKRGVRQLPELPEDVLIDTECDDYLDINDYESDYGNRSMEEILEDVFSRRRDRNDAPGSRERAGASERNRQRELERERRNQETNERRRQQAEAERERDKDRRKDERRERRRAAIEKIFGKPD